MAVRLDISNANAPTEVAVVEVQEGMVATLGVAAVVAEAGVAVHVTHVAKKVISPGSVLKVPMLEEDTVPVVAAATVGLTVVVDMEEAMVEAAVMRIMLSMLTKAAAMAQEDMMTVVTHLVDAAEVTTLTGSLECE